MLKSFKIALFAIAPILLLSHTALTAEPLQPSASQTIAIDDAICYMVTSDGRTLNLTTLCGTLNQGQRAQANRAPVAPTQSRPDLGGLDIYGRGPSAPPCYGLDDNGQPCPTSRS
jgi:hypothetical protein